ncbi:MAG: extracellular solute-binding protein [Lachnospiraceae bacterium]|nr:extracellular solute-binding protein [Lachnospiraceae bacterium]
MKRAFLLIPALIITTVFSGCGQEEKTGELTLRVANWEEYMDQGEWEEAIELSDDKELFAENTLVDDFEIWYEETYGQKINVEYSTYGTNEDLYNQMRLGDVFDLVCPSDYMVMKLISEDRILPLSEEFFETSVEENYYIKNLSPYIADQYKKLSMDGKPVYDYGAGYMWGTLGIVYNPDYITPEDASHFSMFSDKKFYKTVTVKDSIRDTYFAGLAALNADTLTDPDFKADPEYKEKLTEIMNDTSEETVDEVEDILSVWRENVYSMETDSGKSDMVTGKVLANLQWSGDAVYTIDQAEEDGVYLSYSVPDETTNLWFDAWVMMKNGIAQDSRKQQAAEAFINFISRPDNAVRNMDYIGYTSVISGGEDDSTVFDYINYCYSAEEGEESVPYDISYFFDGEGAEGTYVVEAPPEQLHRQLFTQYPSTEVIERSAIMRCFDADANERISRMWTNIRCFRLW